MQEFSKVDFSNESFRNYSLGAGLTSNVFSEDEVRKINDSGMSVGRAFCDLVPFEQPPLDEDSERCYSGKEFLNIVPQAYLNSTSFQTWETKPPFEMLENYIQELAKSEGLLPRVDRAEMYERELFIADLSKRIFESNPNVGAICYYGSFVRGRVNPHDIDIKIFFKIAYPMSFEADDDHSWKGTQSMRMLYKIPGSEFHIYRPTAESYESIADMDKTFLCIENYEKDEKSLFRQLANKNSYDEKDKINFRINPSFFPYEFTSSVSIEGGIFGL